MIITTVTDGVETDSEITIVDGSDGPQGIPGTPGTNGASAYVHIAWGTPTFVDSEIVDVPDFSIEDSIGRTYMGTYADDQINDSLNWEDYSWVKIKG